MLEFAIPLFYSVWATYFFKKIFKQKPISTIYSLMFAFFILFSSIPLAVAILYYGVLIFTSLELNLNSIGFSSIFLGAVFSAYFSFKMCKAESTQQDSSKEAEKTNNDNPWTKQ